MKLTWCGKLRLHSRQAVMRFKISAEAAFSEYVCSPSSTSSSRWLCTVADVLRKERGTRSSKGEKLNCHFRSPYCKRTNRCPDQRQLLCRPMKSSDWAELLENSYIPLAKSKRGEDGQLPTGRQMLTCWHLD